MPILEALLASSASDNGTVRLYSSAIAKVEVAFAATEKEGKALDPEIEQRIDSLWADPAAIVTVDYHDGIGWIARQLLRDAMTRDWRLKFADAVHLATAQWLSKVIDQAIEFHTYSKDLPRYATITGFTILPPYTPQPYLPLDFDTDPTSP